MTKYFVETQKFCEFFQLVDVGRECTIVNLGKYVGMRCKEVRNLLCYSTKS